MNTRISILSSHAVRLLIAVLFVGPGWQSASILGQETGQADLQVELKQLIKDLGSPKYSVRQYATERLWEIGQDATESLEAVVKQADPEVAQRGGELLSILKLGIDSSTKPEIARLVIRFSAADSSIREKILNELIAEDRFQLVFDLLDTLSAKSQAGLYREVFNLNDMIVRLARADRWDLIELVAGHAITHKNDVLYSFYYHLANGQLDDYVSGKRKELDDAIADGKQPEDKLTMQVVAMLRFQGKVDLALQYAKKIKSIGLRTKLITNINMVEGRWKQVDAIAVGKDVPVRPEDGKLVITAAQQAYLKSIIGDTDGYNEVVKKVTKRLEQAKENKEEKLISGYRRTLIAIGMSNLDWDLAEKHLNRDEKFYAFQFYQTSNRIKEAFAAIGVGDDADQRNVWIERRMRMLKSLREKVKRLREKRLDYDKVDSEVARTWTLCFSVVDQLRMLGFDDEAAAHYNTLLKNMSDDERQSRRIQALVGFVRMERGEDCWRIVQNAFSTNEYRQLSYSLFPTKSSTASYFYSQLTDRYRDPLKRLQVVSGIVNSPLGTIDNFDLDAELSFVRSKQTSLGAGFHYQMQRVYQFHGDEAQADRHFLLAKQSGYAATASRDAKEQLLAGKLDEALKYYDDAWKLRHSPVEPMVAAEIYRKLGDFQKAQQRKLLGFAFWRDSYRNTNNISSLKALKQIELALEFIRIDTLAIHGSQPTNERYRSSLAETYESIEPARAANHRRVVMFNALASKSFGEFSEVFCNREQMIQKSIAKHEVNIGRFDSAVGRLMKVNSFFPGDTDIGESLIKEFDAQGASQQADRLFNAIADVYLDVLKQFPGSSHYRNNYAWLCASASRRQKFMLRHAEQALASRPNNSSYLDTIAEISFQLGDVGKAIEYSKKCIQVDPGKEHYQEQLKRFKASQPK